MRLRRPAAIALVLLAVALTAYAQRPRDPVTLAKEGQTALVEKRYGDALEAFTAASKALPSEPGLCVGAGVAAFMLGQNDDAERWFTRALTLDPQTVSAFEWLGELQYREGHVSDAVETYEAALKRSPGNPDIEQRLQAWRNEAQLHDRFQRSYSTHFTVLFEGAADDALAERVIQRLESEYWRIGAALDAYPSRPITVVLYTQQQFRDITRVPAWTAGAYDGTMRVPVHGIGSRSADLQRVLAHEFVHAVVATMGGESVPVWLNEGLAMALEPGGSDDEERVFAALKRRLPLHALDGSFMGLDAPEARAAYAVSAHAVHRMIALGGAPAVAALVKALGNGAEFGPAFSQFIGIRYDEFETTIAGE